MNARAADFARTTALNARATDCTGTTWCARTTAFCARTASDTGTASCAGAASCARTTPDTRATFRAGTARAHGTVIECLAAFDASNRKRVVAIAGITDDEAVVGVKAPVKYVGAVIPSCGPERSIESLLAVIFGGVAETCG